MGRKSRRADHIATSRTGLRAGFEPRRGAGISTMRLNTIALFATNLARPMPRPRLAQIRREIMT